MRHGYHLLETPFDKVDAAARSVQWGFPRPIEVDEINNSVWYGLGEVAIFWFHRIVGEPETDIFPHIALSPIVRGRVLIRDILCVLPAIAEIHGAVRLRFLVGSEFEKMESYLGRMEWYDTADGLAFDLGVKRWETQSHSLVLH